MIVNDQKEEKHDQESIEEKSEEKIEKVEETVEESKEEKTVEKNLEETAAVEDSDAKAESPDEDFDEKKSEEEDSEKLNSEEAISEITDSESLDSETEKETEQKGSEEEQTAEKPAEEKREKTQKEKEKDYMMNLLDEHFSKFEQGKIVEGRVVSIDERNVLVDIGFKSESPISVREFNTNTIPEIGEKIKVYIDSVEDSTGRLQLSKRKADFYLNIDKLESIKKNNESVEGTYKKRVKGGMIVEIFGIEAFLPGSQVSTKPIPNLDQFIGKTSSFKVIKIDRERRNIVISRKNVLIEEQHERLMKLQEKMQKGAELDGEVRNITDYGAFVDLGGIDGLLHITDMSWGHIKHPSDMLNIGDKVRVKVLDFDVEKQKVSLGLKQLVPHPWENIEAKYPEGSIVSGKIVNLTNYGAFVELEPGVEGLVHISEMSWTKKVKHPKQVLKMGDTIKAIVLSASRDDKRISLGIKQMEPNPWITIEQRYPVDSVIEGKVKSLTPFGVFVEIENNIEGLVHISDISWTKRIYHPKEVLNRGETIKVKVLSIDKTLHRIALGIKQLERDPWENLDEKLPINTEITAKIAKIISKGVLVDVEVDDYVVEGFVPLSHLGIPGLKKAGMAFEVNESIPLKIIELDLENRRLILSVKAYFFAKEETEQNKFIDEHQKRIKAKLGKRRKIKEIITKAEKDKQAKQESKEPQASAEQEKKISETEAPESKNDIEKTDEKADEEKSSEQSSEQNSEQSSEQSSTESETTEEKPSSEKDETEPKTHSDKIEENIVVSSKIDNE